MSNQLKSNSNPRRRRSLVSWILAAACLLLTTGLQAQAPPEKEAPDILRQLSDSFEALAKRVSPAVVQILVTGFGPVEEEGATATALIAKQHITGSGVIVDARGYIITKFRPSPRLWLRGWDSRRIMVSSFRTWRREARRTQQA